MRGWPLKRQIRLLGVMALATAIVSLALAVGLSRQSESARAADAARNLAQAASQMAARYAYPHRRCSPWPQGRADREGPRLVRRHPPALGAFPGEGQRP